MGTVGVAIPVKKTVLLDNKRRVDSQAEDFQTLPLSLFESRRGVIDGSQLETTSTHCPWNPRSLALI